MSLSRHAAVVVWESFVDDDELPRPLREGVVVDGEEPADRHEVVLLRREDRAVGRGRQRMARMISGSDTSAQPGSRSSMKTAFSEILVASRTNGTRTPRSARAPRARCPSRTVGRPHVQTGLLTYECDSLGPWARTRSRATRSMLPLNGSATRVVSLRAGDVDQQAAGELDMESRGREVEVRGNRAAPARSGARLSRCSAPRPWCVGISWRYPYTVCMAASSR